VIRTGAGDFSYKMQPRAGCSCGNCGHSSTFVSLTAVENVDICRLGNQTGRRDGS
jgi:hypothetical protein